jgi:bla regulator protein BlaR1
MNRLLLAIFLTTPLAAQTTLSFEVASVRRAEPGSFKPPNVPMNAGDQYAPTGGRYTATSALVNFITFAYKLTLTRDQRQALVAHLPGWVATDSFAIEAHAPASLPDPTKDQMRQMMQSLLADRFKLKIHFETQQTSLLALTLAKPGQLGPKLVRNTSASCTTPPAASPAASAGGESIFPTLPCDTYVMTAKNDHTRILTGARDTSMAMFAATLPNLFIPGQGSVLGSQERPVIDRTGLDGRFDMVVEWAADPSSPFPPFGVDPDPAGPTFTDALRDELGLKLELIKGPIQVLVIDHAEQPSDN